MTVNKLEDQPPVLIHMNRPQAFSITRKRMKSPAWYIHVVQQAEAAQGNVLYTFDRGRQPGFMLRDSGV